MILRTVLVLGALLAVGTALAEPPCPVPAGSQFNAGTTGCGYSPATAAAGVPCPARPWAGRCRVHCPRIEPSPPAG